MSDKRIVIMEVSGDCRHIRVVKGAVDMEDGYYCAACPHSGWERIDPKQCESCTREKILQGVARKDLVELIRQTIFYYDYKKIGTTTHLTMQQRWEQAETVLDAILEAKKWSL